MFEPNAEILYKCGGTLLYRKEIYRVIIVCCKERSIDPLNSIPDYNFTGNITLTQPFQGVKYIPNGEGGPGARYLMTGSSWDTFVFAFYQPLSNQMSSLSVSSQEISLEQVRHQMVQGCYRQTNRLHHATRILRLLGFGHSALMWLTNLPLHNCYNYCGISKVIKRFWCKKDHSITFSKVDVLSQVICFSCS